MIDCGYNTELSKAISLGTQYSEFDGSEHIARPKVATSNKLAPAVDHVDGIDLLVSELEPKKSTTSNTYKR